MRIVQNQKLGKVYRVSVFQTKRNDIRLSIIGMK